MHYLHVLLTKVAHPLTLIHAPLLSTKYGEIHLVHKFPLITEQLAIFVHVYSN